MEDTSTRTQRPGPGQMPGSPLPRWREKFLEFYRTVYLKDHASPANRWVHFLSNVLAIVSLSAAVIFWSWELLLLGAWFQLGPPYLGHIVFEGSHRSIDRSWILSAVGSWYTTLQIIIGKQSITHGVRAPLPATASAGSAALEASGQNDNQRESDTPAA